MQTLYVVPEAVALASSRNPGNRDKKIMDNLAFRKEKPEAIEVMALDQLTADTLADQSMTEWEKAIALSDNLQKFLALKAQAFPEPPPFTPPPTVPQPPPPPSIPAMPTVPANSSRLSNQLRHVKDFLTSPTVNRINNLHRSGPVSPVNSLPGLPMVPLNVSLVEMPHMDLDADLARDPRKRNLSVTPTNSPVSSTGGEPLLEVVSGTVISGREAAERRANVKRSFKRQPPRKRRGAEVTPTVDINSSFYKEVSRRTRAKKRDSSSPQEPKLTEASRGKTGVALKKTALLDKHIRRGLASTVAVQEEPDSWELDTDREPMSVRLQRGAGYSHRSRWIVI